ncbi:MAG: serine protease [Mediterranea sp.]|jgi:tetratricopeptide (TPR) repeat protein|nr:serine protease [Mediterranea sp.]
MKKILCLTWMLLCLAQAGIQAQTPKWVEKAKRAVFSVVTYDKNNKMLNTGNGFFVSEDGVALSDYTLFKGAQRAVIITPEGKEMPVDKVLGANDMYDVIKFRVAITEKRVPALTVARTAPAVGTDTWMLPYSTQKSIACLAGKVKEVSKVNGDYFYYTLSMEMKDKMVSCPVMNANGEVYGLAQKASGKDTLSICYASGARFALSQKITALSLSDNTLNAIGIRKGLPDTEEQALVYLFMASSQMSPDAYLRLLDDFVGKYPNSTDGYIRRAGYYIAKDKDDAAGLDKASADMDQALKIAKKKDDVYYNIAKMIYNYQLSKPTHAYKDWTFDKALENVRQAITIDPLPIYTQLEGDILFAKQDYAGALTAYEKVNASNLASSATFFSAAKTKELLQADPKEILALMDSCVAHLPQPVTPDLAPYLLERAQAYMNVDQARSALLDYDAYYNAVKGDVNDLFYYYREQAALKSRQYQRALDDIAKAIELNSADLTYKAEQAALNLRVGRYEIAISQLDDLIKTNPKYSEAYRLLGLCYVQQKKMNEACANFQKAKELNDPNVDSLITKYCK